MDMIEAHEIISRFRQKWETSGSARPYLMQVLFDGVESDRFLEALSWVEGTLLAMIEEDKKE